MTLAKQIRERVLRLDEGAVVTLADFDLPMKQQPALNVTLNRLVAEGVLRRLSKGRFYREKVSVFGPLPPSETEVVKDFLAKNGKTVGYITGTQAFAEMGLTTQISSRLLVGTNKYRRTVTRGDSYFASQVDNVRQDSFYFVNNKDIAAVTNPAPFPKLYLCRRNQLRNGFGRSLTYWKI